MEKKWTKWYAMTSHVIAYRSKELLFGMHAFNFNSSADTLLICTSEYTYAKYFLLHVFAVIINSRFFLKKMVVIYFTNVST